MSKEPDERREFGERPPPDELRAWQAWMRTHGIDPNNVPIGKGWVERHGRVVRYLALVRIDGRIVWPRGAEAPLTEVRECQVYSRRPAPFPT